MTRLEAYLDEIITETRSVSPATRVDMQAPDEALVYPGRRLLALMDQQHSYRIDMGVLDGLRKATRVFRQQDGVELLLKYEDELDVLLEQKKKIMVWRSDKYEELNQLRASKQISHDVWQQQADEAIEEFDFLLNNINEKAEVARSNIYRVKIANAPVPIDFFGTSQPSNSTIFMPSIAGLNINSERFRRWWESLDSEQQMAIVKLGRNVEPYTRNIVAVVRAAVDYAPDAVNTISSISPFF